MRRLFTKRHKKSHKFNKTVVMFIVLNNYILRFLHNYKLIKSILHL
jgi:hypothetical protein